MAFGPIFWVLTGLGLAAAAAYGLVFLNRPPSLLRAAVKTLFLAAPTAAFIIAGAPFPLVFALAAAAFGDLFLAFDKKWTLPLGILSFLLAQLTYFVIFAALWFFSGDNSPLWPRYLAMGLLSATLLGYLGWFWRGDEFKRKPILSTAAIAALVSTGALLPFILFAGLAVMSQSSNAHSDLRDAPYYAVALAYVPAVVLVVVPILAVALAIIRRRLGGTALAAMVYAGAIMGMAVMAMWLPWRGWPAMLGALLFVTSDFVLATELFRLPPDAPIRRITAPVVWWTYVAAQVLIVAGILIVAARVA